MLYNNFIETLRPEEVLIYLRKSRTDDPSLTVEEVLKRHETTLDEWTERHLGEKIPDCNKIKEIGSGETIESRPGFLYLLKQIESPRIKAVLVKDCARLGRPDLEEIGRISKLFRYTSTIVITPERTFDINDEWQRDSFERELMKSNEVLNYYKKIQQAGRERSCADGWFIGQHPPYGYDKTVVTENKRKCHTLIPNEEQAEVVRLIFDLYVNKDMGRHNICHHLDSMGITPPRGEHWSPASLKDMLVNEHYIGKIRWYWRKTTTSVEDGEIVKTRPNNPDYLLYDGRHPAIISEELFYGAREKIGRNHRAKPTTKVRNPLASLLYCECGRAMSLRFYKNKDGSERAEPRLLCDDQVHCKSGSCLYSEMIEMVVDILKRKIADYQIKVTDNNEDIIKERERVINNLEKKLSTLKAKELAQWEAQSDPDPTKRMPQYIFQQLNEKLQKEKETVEDALKRAYETMPTKVDYEQKIVTLEDALNALLDPDKSAETKNRLLKACIERIDYKREPPQRIKSQQVLYYDKEKKHTRKKSPLKTGANWTVPPIELEVKLKV